jgi:hypothetical protein
MTEHISFVVISDCSKYYMVAVCLFQSKLCSFLSGKLKDFSKTCYFSDGTASQDKNRKNSINLYHKDNSGMDTEQHFFVTEHGKGAYDGTGRKIKKLARQAGLEDPYEEKIRTQKTSLQVDCCKDSLSQLLVLYC